MNNGACLLDVTDTVALLFLPLYLNHHVFFSCLSVSGDVN